MAWNEAVVTNDGLELLARCVMGGSIEITSAAGGYLDTAAHNTPCQQLQPVVGHYRFIPSHFFAPFNSY